MTKQTRDFDKQAAKWDENPARVKLAADVAGAIARGVSIGSSMEVLDFGCGTGLVTMQMAPRVKSVTGADTSRGMIEVLEAKARQQDFTNVQTKLLHPGESLSGRYDLIVSSMTFHHIERIDAALEQSYRALKTPGHLCVADLDLEQGEFHEDNTGVFHFGFDRAVLRESFARAGFLKISATTAAEVMKPTRNGVLRKFTVFLMVGEKAPR